MSHEIATEEVDNDEIEQDICRICRSPGDVKNTLRFPCACNGTIKFVHRSCLLRWLRRSNSHHCEVCKHRISFTKVYAENAPTRLPLMEFVTGIKMKHFRDLRYFTRLCFVGLAWLFVIPFVTFWIWRLAFVRSFDEAWSLFLSHVSMEVILGDCLVGFVLSASIVIVLVGPTSLRDIYWHLIDGGPFGEIVGLREPMFRLVKNAFIGLANNLMFIGVVIFVPFTLGRVILYHMSWLFAATVSLVNITIKRVLASVLVLTNEGHENGLLGQLIEMMKSKLNRGSNILSAAVDFLKGSDVTTLTVGYMFIVFLVFLCRGIITLIRYAKVEPLTNGRLYGIASIVEAIPTLLRQFLAAMRRGTGVAYFVVVVLGVYPLMLGWWLDVCTIRMFDKKMSHRLHFLSVSPFTSSLVHWVVGIIYITQDSIFWCLLQEVLRPGVLYDSEDEDDLFQVLIDEPLHKLARETLLETVRKMSLIFVQVFLPVKLAAWMAPSIFPLNISVSDPYTEIPAGVLLFQICISFMMEHFRLCTKFKSLLRCWITAVSWALGLTDFLLPRPEENRNVKKGEEYDDDEEQSDFEYNFVLRIILLLLVAFVTLILFNSALIVIQVSLGRALFSAIPLLPITHGIKCNDLYAFVIGSYALWTSIYGAKYAIGHVKSKRTSVLFNQMWNCCAIVFKSSVLLAIWVFIIPVLIGLLFELSVIVPMRVPVDESPVFLLYQDWALGLFLLKIWTRLVTQDIMLPFVGDTWRAKFERVRQDGFSSLQGLWVLREIVYPIVMKLLTALCVPYVLARGVFPILGYPLVVNSAVYRFTWMGCLSVSLFCFCAKRCHVQYEKIHKLIRDERYLLGQRLDNFGEAAL